MLLQSKKVRYYIWMQRLSRAPLFLISLTILLSLFGVLLLYSAGYTTEERWYIMQLHGLIIGIILMLATAVVNISFFYHNAYNIYYILCIVLLIVNLMGHSAMGAQRWLKLSNINIQPSEFMKLGIILALARYYSKLHYTRINHFIPIIQALGISIVPTILIIRQPNLGSGLIIFIICLGMIFATGVSYWKLGAFFSIIICFIPLTWTYFLYPYQKQRVLTFLNPELDPLGSGYNIMQSKIAIGSGGINGKGLFQGSQTQLYFLPEKQTDFIFTILAEEFGLIGVMFILFLYMILCIYTISLTWLMCSQFCRLVVLGINIMTFIHIAINLGMISGILPVAGIPLPFLSYGRSNLILMYISYGLIINSYINRNRQLK